MKKLGKHKLYRGDCLKIMSKIPDESIDVVISDPPYGIDYADWDVVQNSNSALGGASKAQSKSKLFKRRGKPLNGWSKADRGNASEFCRFLSNVSAELARITKPGSTCLIFSSRRYLGQCQLAFENAGFTTADIICWDKISAPFRAQRISEVLSRRATKTPTKLSNVRLGNLAPLWEPVVWFRKPYKIGTTLVDNVLNYGVGGFNGDVVHNNIISVSSKATTKSGHPTEKPLELMEILVRLVSHKGQICLDPFQGSGSTGVACVNTGRTFIGIEKDKTYFKIALGRIRKARRDKKAKR